MADETEFDQTLKNYLAVILGFAELLIEGMSADDPRFEDLREIQKTARDAIALVDRKGKSST